MAKRLVVEIVGDPTSVQRAFKTVGKDASLLERRFGTAGKAANTAFTRIGSAARRATPFVTAFGAIALGKAVSEAVEAEKASKQTEAVIKSMGNSARVSAKHVEELANSLSVKAGVDDEAIQSAENLLLTFGNIRNEAGEGNKVFDETTRIALDMSVALGQDLSKSAIQLGKAVNDPTVGLTALRRVGVSFNEQQTEQIQTLFESGEQLKAQKLILRELTREFSGSAAAQATSFDKLKVTAENFAESIGMKLLPGLQELADQLSNIINDKSLTSEQKIDRIARLFEDIAIKGIDKLADLAPRFAEVGGKLGIRMVAGLARGFLESDTLGKLFITGAILRTLGGPGAFSGVGRTIGAWIGLGVGQGVAAGAAGGGAAAGGAAGGGILAALRKVKWARVGALGVGIALADGIFNTIEEHAKRRSPDIAEALGATPTAQAAGLLAVLKDIEDARVVTPQQREAVKNLAGSMDLTEEQARDLRRRLVEIDKVQFQRIREQSEGLRKQLTSDSKNVRRAGVSNTKQMARDMGIEWTRLRDMITGKSDDIALEVFQTLKALGVSDPAIRAEIGRRSSFSGKGGKQRGGMIPGVGVGDTVPIMAEPGEGFINKRAVQALGGPPAIDAINAMFPRFQKGGVLTLSVTGRPGAMRDTAQGALGSEVRAANRLIGKTRQQGGDLGATGNIVTLGRSLQKKGYLVSEHPAFGGVNAVHAPNSYHYRGRAIDVNWPNASTEPTFLDKIAGPLRSNSKVVELLWRTAGHFDHLHVAMQRGGVVPRFQRGGTLGFEDRLGLLDIAFTRAEQTPGTADDIRVLGRRLRLIRRRESTLERRLRRVNRQLRKKGLSKRKRRELREQRSAIISDLGGVVSDISGTTGQISDLTGAETTTTGEDTAELLKQIRDELKQSNAIAQSESAISRNEALRMMVDLLSGEIGARAFGQTVGTAGAGSVARF